MCCSVIVAVAIALNANGQDKRLGECNKVIDLDLWAECFCVLELNWNGYMALVSAGLTWLWLAL